MHINPQNWDEHQVLAADPAQRLTLLVIDRRPLILEALISLLGTIAAFRVIAIADQTCLEELSADVRSIVDMAILSLGSDNLRDEATRSTIAAIQQAVPRAPLVVIGDRDDAGHVGEALRLNLRGYVPASLTSQILRGALRLVEAGGTFIPVGALTEAIASKGTGAVPGTGQADAYPMGLTKRQMQVLELLKQGKPNKLIAYELSMRESTVKVHVRQIMRKLQVNNRTEAAFFSLNAPLEA